MSRVAVAAGLLMLGLTLELEACSGARGALKERKHQVSNRRKKYVGNNVKRRNSPQGNMPLLLRNRHANLLPLLCRLRLGFDPALLAHTHAGRGRSLV
jgi:hypothetical protein